MYVRGVVRLSSVVPPLRQYAPIEPVPTAVPPDIVRVTPLSDAARLPVAPRLLRESSAEKAVDREDLRDFVVARGPKRAGEKLAVSCAELGLARFDGILRHGYEGIDRVHGQCELLTAVEHDRLRRGSRRIAVRSEQRAKADERQYGSAQVRDAE